MSYAVITVTTDPDEETLEAVYRLRVEAWRQRLNIPPEITRWKDPCDADAMHWVFVQERRPIAAARLTIHREVGEVPDAAVIAHLVTSLPAPIASINRCVVSPDFRGGGLSSQLDSLRMDAARLNGCKSVVATISDERRCSSLERHGFIRLGAGLPDADGILKGDSNVVYVAYI